MAKLKELNNQAEAGMHTDVQGRQSDEFQLLYTQVRGSCHCQRTGMHTTCFAVVRDAEQQ